MDWVCTKKTFLFLFLALERRVMPLSRVLFYSTGRQEERIWRTGVTAHEGRREARKAQSHWFGGVAEFLTTQSNCRERAARTC